MRAFYFESYGSPEVMKIGELPEPIAAKGEVLVEVKASSVNPLDWKLREGHLKVMSGKRFPKIVGTDFAGVVKALGPGVTEFTAGDKVYGSVATMFGKQGAHAELVVAPSKKLRPLPEGLSFENAASLPVGALTALNGLRPCGDLQGKEVIVNGGTGGVGHFAVQVAKARGAIVTAVCSAKNAERAKEFGADIVIDYREKDFLQGEKSYDVVFDAFGKVTFGQAAKVLNKGGFFISTLPSFSLMFRMPWQNLFGSKKIALGNMRDKPEDYNILEKLISEGKLKPTVEKSFPLDESSQAYETLEKGGTVGKIVITI